MDRFAGRTAVVTGAAQGIGAETARRLASEGAKVALLDVKIDEATEIARGIERKGGSARVFQCDVADSALVDKVFVDVAAAFGPVNVLVHNAGVLRDNLLFRMSDDEFDVVIDVHLRGAFFTARAAQRQMVEERYGKIVLLSSRAALGNRGQANYSAAKAGVQGMARTLAIELGPFGVNVNVVAPGHIDTPMTRSTAERMGIDYEQMKTVSIEQNSIKRIGSPSDVASAIAFLSADESSYITGQVLYVAGRPLP